MIFCSAAPLPSCAKEPGALGYLRASSRGTSSWWRRPAASRYCKRVRVWAAGTTTALAVTVREVSMVRPPHEATHAATCFLSNLDVQVLPLTVEVVLAYAPTNRMSARDPCTLLKHALHSVLPHYYPLAGHLALHHDRPSVACSGQGVCFAEACADMDISGLGHLHPATLSCLLYPFPALDHPPLLTAQVTRFTCGGFVLGLAFQHCMMDGAAAVEFLNSWAGAARGVAPLSVRPALDRTFLRARSPLQVDHAHDEYLEIQDLSSPAPSGSIVAPVLQSFTFSRSSLDRLKGAALQDGVLKRCSTFQALTGLLWQVRTKAMGMEPQQKVKVFSALDARFIGGVGFPRGYLGNGVMMAGAIASAGELERSPLSYAVKHVQDGIYRVNADYVRSHIDFLEREGARLPSMTATLGVTTWSKLGFHEVDFGWGGALHVVPISQMLPELAIILAHGEDRKGLNLLLCHSPQVLAKMEELLRPHLHP